MGDFTSYIIGAVLIAIIVIIIGLILRKRIYDRVDELESWKMDVMHRQVSAELQRVKALNLSGETQERFEHWKETWDHILTRELPDIEEYLFDAEEAADRFRIKYAKKNLATVESILTKNEETIKTILKELEDLLDSEKQSREAIETVTPILKELRHVILENQHLYGPAENRFEQALDQEQQAIEEFYAMCDDGNYFEARQHVEKIKASLETIGLRIDEFPLLYKKMTRDLPEQIQELKNGIKEMKREGYRINDEVLLTELREMEKQLKIYISRVEQTDEPAVYDWLQAAEDRIQEIYVMLEKEAKAKHYLEKHMDPFTEDVQAASEDFALTDEEVKTLQQTYLLEGSDLELYENLAKWMHQLEKDHNQLLNSLSSVNQTYLSLKEQLELNQEDLKKFKESHVEFRDQVRSIRSDELEAKQVVETKKRALFNLEKRLEKSNLPGVPDYIKKQCKDNHALIETIQGLLHEQPLNMGQVNTKIKELHSNVDILSEKVQLMIEQAYLTERVIQYANRYRSQYPMLQAKLLEAEQLFYQEHYEEALELSAQALEEVAPGAVQRLEERIELPY
jgi:septation ring formation regulator